MVFLADLGDPVFEGFDFHFNRSCDFFRFEFFDFLVDSLVLGDVVAGGIIPAKLSDQGFVLAFSVASASALERWMAGFRPATGRSRPERCGRRALRLCENKLGDV